MIKVKYISKADAVEAATPVGQQRGIYGLSYDRMALANGRQYRYNPDVLPDKLTVDPAASAMMLHPSLGVGVFFLDDLHRANSDYCYLLLPLSKIQEEERQEFIDVANAVLGKEMPGRYFIHPSTNIVYIWYPEIHLSNSIGTQYTVYDFILRLDPASNGMGIANMYGGRVSFTSKEIEHAFTHPHVQRNGSGNWGGFCFGSGTPVQTFFKKIQGGVTEDNFSLFLTQMDHYLQWESLEGTPYASINDMVSSSVIDTTTTANLRSGTRDRLAKEFLKRLTPEMLTNSDGRWILVPKNCEDALLALEKAIVNDMQLDSSYTFKYDEESNNYVRSTEERRRSLPDISSDMQDVVRALGINRRLIEPPKPAVATSRRIGQRDLGYIIDIINQHLVNG